MRKKVWFLVVLCSLSSGSVCTAGRIVVANDDWTLSDSGFAMPNDAGTFAQNVASWFTGGAPGSFLVYSDHFGLTGASLQEAMTSEGHGWTIDTSVTFDLSTLLAYDGVFVGVTPADNAALTDYVSAGGNVYTMGGGNPGEDSLLWNDFLGAFGLNFGNINSLVGDIPISNPHALFTGVDHLFNVNGTSIIDLAPSDSRNQLLVEYAGEWAYAVYDGSMTTVPAPGAVVLGIIGSGVAACLRRRLL